MGTSSLEDWEHAVRGRGCPDGESVRDKSTADHETGALEGWLKGGVCVGRCEGGILKGGWGPRMAENGVWLFFLEFPQDMPSHLGKLGLSALGPVEFSFPLRWLQQVLRTHALAY